MKLTVNNRYNKNVAIKMYKSVQKSMQKKNKTEKAEEQNTQREHTEKD